MDLKMANSKTEKNPVNSLNFKYKGHSNFENIKTSICKYGLNIIKTMSLEMHFSCIYLPSDETRTIFKSFSKTNIIPIDATIFCTNKLTSDRRQLLLTSAVFRINTETAIHFCVAWLNFIFSVSRLFFNFNLFNCSIRLSASLTSRNISVTAVIEPPSSKTQKQLYKFARTLAKCNDKKRICGINP